jgi:hypothetical protein
MCFFGVSTACFMITLGVRSGNASMEEHVSLFLKGLIRH